MSDTRVWSELAQECEAREIEYSQADDADVLRDKLGEEDEPSWLEMESLEGLAEDEE